MTEDNRKYDIGDVISVGGEDQEVVAVSYGENPDTGERERFTYQFRNKQELDDEREAQRKADEEREARERGEEPEQSEETPDPTEEDVANDLANEQNSPVAPQ